MLEAARLKEDHAILCHIENRDCVAIELMYHASCHREYTRFLSRGECSGEEPEKLYSLSFDKFCEHVIVDKIILGKEVLRLTKLKKLFDKTVMDTEGKDSSGYKTWNLKKRLASKFPQLCFQQPSRKYESDFVYVDNLSTDKLIEESTILHESIVGTDSSDTDDNELQCEHLPTRSPSSFNANKETKSMSTVRERFSTALDVKRKIDDVSTSALPWPPTADDLTMDYAEEIIPPILFNLIAWMVGASQDPADEEFVKVTDVEKRRILTIAQDIIYLASKGKKVMPKQISLAMAVRHLSGSAQLVGILNGLGYSVSHSFVLEHDTALAQREIERGSTGLLSCIQSGVYTTLVWDNNDFGEETLSGKGTTHNTNGIVVQHVESPIVTQTTPPPTKKTKKRSLHAPDKNIVSFHGAKKSSPDVFPTSVALQLDSHLALLQPQKDKDTAYYLTKHTSEPLLPSWTGFNQLLTTDVPPRATIGYLPVVDASPTELNTVNTILHRSVEIAD